MKSSHWYINKNLKPVGPFSVESLREMTRSGDVGPQDLICQGEAGHWQEARYYREFEISLFPATQGFVPGIENAEAEWVVLKPTANGGSLMQEGPYTKNEILDFLSSGDLQESFYVWKSGLSGWSRISDRPEFQKSVESIL